MTSNGKNEFDYPREDDWRSLLKGARNADNAMAVLDRAAKALAKAASSLRVICAQVDLIGEQTASAISETAALKAHVRRMSDREPAASRKGARLKRKRKS